MAAPRGLAAPPRLADGLMSARDPARPYRSLFSGFFLPRHPGHSGGEIRDYHLIRQLLRSSTVEFFAFHRQPPEEEERPDRLGPLLAGVHTPETLPADAVDHAALRPPTEGRVAARLRALGLPVPARHHADAAHRIPSVRAYSRPLLQRRLRETRPDFLFVSPQLNPVALTLDLAGVETRLVLASYDVEAVRVRRLAATQRGLDGLRLRLEARRAARFERDNLALFDGVIAVSELDRGRFTDDYGFPSDRVLALANGVDSEYFAFSPRAAAGSPSIVFVGSLGYPPNAQAALRLVDGILPAVRQRHPQVRLHLVGQSPPAALSGRADPPRVVVTGRVDDVRPYLAEAAVCCIPLSAGSGTKYKVLEALSAGVPVVCTRMALEGLELRDGEHVVVAETDDALAAGVSGLLGDPERGAAMARRARQEVEARHSWDVLLPALEPWLAALRARPPRKP
jgi:glycosyltransferase involved in cell wall biosynthesis